MLLCGVDEPAVADWLAEAEGASVVVLRQLAVRAPMLAGLPRLVLVASVVPSAGLGLSP